MNPVSLGNLVPAERSRPEGTERVEVDVFLVPHDAKRWRKLTPGERGAAISAMLQDE